MRPDTNTFEGLMIELEDSDQWSHRIGPDTPDRLAHAKLLVDDGYLEHEGDWMFRMTSKGHALCYAIRKEAAE